MLAQNFMTAEALEIDEPQRLALIKTLVLMETGKLHLFDYKSTLKYLPDDCHFNFTGHFNMADWCQPYECGTVACIGGTAELIGGVTFDRQPIELHNLFYVCEATDAQLDMSKITVEQAARALRSYLTTGKAGWKEILE